MPENEALPTSKRVNGVSIVIPAYDSQNTIAETLNSVLAQTYQGWEAIVVDDGSQDSTAEIVRQYANSNPRIRFVNQANAGEAGARNTGISEARYDWLLFLDADDWIDAHHLERLTTELETKPELDAVHCRSARVAQDGTMVEEKYHPPAGDLFSILARRAAFPVHACLVRKSLVEAVGCFDTSLVKSPDWDLWQRIARTGANFGAVKEMLAFYRMRPHAASLDAGQMLRDGLTVLQRGHSTDPRVRNPHPAHRNGAPAQEIPTQTFYLLCWCAGLILGTRRDARFLLEYVNANSVIELHPDAVAQCIFDSAPLPDCLSPGGWEQLAPEILPHADNFLIALQKKTETHDLARLAGIKLRQMILRHSSLWREVVDDYEEKIGHLEAVLSENKKRFCEIENKLAMLSEQSNFQDYLPLAGSKLQIHLEPGETATTRYPTGSPFLIRVEEITNTTREPHCVQLNVSGLTSILNRGYLVNFRAYADSRRPVTIGFSRAHPPWDNLGLCNRMELDSGWHDFEMQFIATAEDANARLHFDLGESDIPVEIAFLQFAETI